MVNQKALAVLAALALATTNGLTPEAQAAPPPPAMFRIGLVGDTGYDARGQANFIGGRDHAKA